eukprot:CAMPEP_0184694730 /NCGR_PEP_ID=MMETSP0313-20130426/2589_1 /TAXON_ID=2792 /ORGANISM="Porphyridium aerugineum, Strain SAG 1380-2" /LENGTH=78 /DNA_ID=CAMNT_0027153067 /DNA_START=266 /DNA_END=502 /DNA_ORIENTATION=+
MTMIIGVRRAWLKVRIEFGHEGIESRVGAHGEAMSLLGWEPFLFLFGFGLAVGVHVVVVAAADVVVVVGSRLDLDCYE